MSEELDRLERRLERERLARKQAEQLLEKKSRELFEANEALKASARDLERQVELRTAELKAALDRAQAATNAKSEFLAMMSHEIRTPLNGLLGMAELLSMSPLNLEQIEQLATIRRSGDDLLGMINEILDFSRIEAGKLELESRPFDLETELRSLIDLYRPGADAKNLVLAFTTQGAVNSTVIGDSTRLRQIVSNLLSNALKFTSVGQIDVKAQVTMQGDSALRLIVDVTDTGIGIPAERRHRLFKAFSQVDSSTTRRFGGTGLGLAICAKLCSAMGGYISVQGKEDKGSNFHFEVILARAETIIASPSNAGSAGALPVFQGRVMVVEDIPANRMVITGMLTKLGLRFASYEDGQQAVDAIVAGEQFDLALMDVQMPVLDGLEATRLIRDFEKTNRLPRLPIIALSAGVFSEEQNNTIAAGMDGFLAKPIGLKSLREALSPWLAST